MLLERFKLSMEARHRVVVETSCEPVTERQNTVLRFYVEFHVRLTGAWISMNGAMRRTALRKRI